MSLMRLPTLVGLASAMKVSDVLSLTGATKRSIYRWMESHPSVAVEDTRSLLGHPFPKPISKEGREVVWDESAVHAWWNDNAATLGRHPVETPTGTMPWTSFRKVMLSEPRSVENDSNGEMAVVSDDMDLVQRFERQGDQVRLWFRNVGDAVYFKLKH